MVGKVQADGLGVHRLTQLIRTGMTTRTELDYGIDKIMSGERMERGVRADLGDRRVKTSLRVEQEVDPHVSVEGSYT